MKQSYVPDTKFIIYTGRNKLRPDEVWKMHGLEFQKGFVYKVTPEVFEYVKALTGFLTVNGVKEGVQGFK